MPLRFQARAAEAYKDTIEVMCGHRAAVHRGFVFFYEHFVSRPGRQGSRRKHVESLYAVGQEATWLPLLYLLYVRVGLGLGLGDALDLPVVNIVIALLTIVVPVARSRAQ